MRQWVRALALLAKALGTLSSSVKQTATTRPGKGAVTRSVPATGRGPGISRSRRSPKTLPSGKRREVCTDGLRAGPLLPLADGPSRSGLTHPKPLPIPLALPQRQFTTRVLAEEET